MKIRTKFRILFFSLFFFGISSGFLSYIINPEFIPLFGLALFFLIGISAINLRCPNCNKPVLYNFYPNLSKLFYGKEKWLWTFWVPRKCQKCGTEIN